MKLTKNDQAANKYDEHNYLLGHSPEEIERLKYQAVLLKPITERLLRSAGLTEGMHVLDLGCGAGDVSMLAADLVGSSGRVVAIDRNATVMETAYRRAQLAGLSHIEFVQSEIETFVSHDRFDAIIGRYVLIYAADPGASLRAAARYLKPNGIFAFQEANGIVCTSSLPTASLWDQCGTWCAEVYRHAVPHPDVALRFSEFFQSAELGVPNIFCEVPVAGDDQSMLFDWMLQNVSTLRPQITALKLNGAEQLTSDFADRLRDSVRRQCSQIFGPAQVCAWIKTSS